MWRLSFCNRLLYKKHATTDMNFQKRNYTGKVLLQIQIVKKVAKHLNDVFTRSRLEVKNQTTWLKNRKLAIFNFGIHKKMFKKVTLIKIYNLYKSAKNKQTFEVCRNLLIEKLFMVHEKCIDWKIAKNIFKKCMHENFKMLQKL